MVATVIMLAEWGDLLRTVTLLKKLFPFNMVRATKSLLVRWCIPI